MLETNLPNERSVKVRAFPGATVEDLQNHVFPLIRRKLKFIVLHCGTNGAIIQKKPKLIVLHAGKNDAVRLTSREILK